MNTCQTCSHWTPLASDAVKRWAIHHNDKVIEAIFRECNHPLLSVRRLNQEARNHPAAALGVVNESTAPIVTGPDFGCVHWKAAT